MSSFDKFMYAKQRVEAQRQAEIRERTSGNLPSIVSRPNAGPDQDALFQAKLQMQEFMLIIIAYDVLVALFLVAMGQKMDAFQGNQIVELFIIPAMHKLATVVFYVMYASYTASLIEMVLHLRQCWYARSITLFRVIDILILLACTHTAITRPLDATLRVICIGRLVRFADVLIMLQQRLTMRLSQNRTAWILEKEVRIFIQHPLYDCRRM
jgi:predicted neutral ceramidase superfamily lipid hydrolase